MIDVHQIEGFTSHQDEPHATDDSPLNGLRQLHRLGGDRLGQTPLKSEEITDSAYARTRGLRCGMNRTWWVKLRRAEKHTAEFERAFTRLSKRDKQFFVERRIETYRNGDHLVIRGYPWKFNGDDIAAIVGDIISNTRAALDHIFVALTVNEDAHFPIYTYDIWQADPDPKTGANRNKSRRDTFEKWTVNTPASAIALIKSVQPYADWPDTPKFHPLAVLNTLSNADKHRTLLVMSAYMFDARIECTFDGVHVDNHFASDTGKRVDGAIFGIYPVPPTKAKVKVKAHGRIEIALQGIDRIPSNVSFELPSSITAIVSHVRNGIIAPLDAMIS